MKRGVRRKPYKFVCQSKRTDLRIHIGQIIKVRGVKYEVVPELREKGLQMGCWGCAFNQATKREDFEIPLCKCTLQNDRYPVTVFIYIKKRIERELCYTCHDLYCACTGVESLIYKLKS
jgi:hypothetical protein|nr:MAG TPA: hypothetical protein [Herelleviridae sp.]